jgi:hypothetical protein
MRSRVRNSFEFLSMSALDLFASALGVFVLVSFVLLPFYLKQPSLDAATTGAQAELAAIADELTFFRQKLTATQSARREAEATLADAQRRLAAASIPQPEPKATPVVAAPIPLPKPGSIAIPPLDLVLVIDTTGSMRDELREIQAGILAIVRILNRLSPSLAVGIVAYRDRGEEYVTLVHPLKRIDDRALKDVLAFVGGLSARGGEDDPEAVEVALAEAMKLAWRDRTMGRIVVIGDQPPRPAQLQSALDIAARFRSADPPGRALGAIYAGVDGHPAGSFFEQLAKAGGGDFRVHRGEMIESVLLSSLSGARRDADERRR